MITAQEDVKITQEAYRIASSEVVKAVNVVLCSSDRMNPSGGEASDYEVPIGDLVRSLAIRIFIIFHLGRDIASNVEESSSRKLVRREAVFLNVIMKRFRTEPSLPISSVNAIETPELGSGEEKVGSFVPSYEANVTTRTRVHKVLCPNSKLGTGGRRLASKESDTIERVSIFNDPFLLEGLPSLVVLGMNRPIGSRIL